MAQQPNRQQQQAELAALIAAYGAQTTLLRTNLSSQISRLWRSLGSWRNSDMKPFVTQAVPLVQGGQQQMAGLTAAFLAHQRRILFGGTGTPAAVNPARVTGAAVRKANPVDVYERPFHLVWRELAELPREPGSIEQAITSGLDRAVNLAVTDLQLAKTHTVQRIVSADRQAIGTRRVLEGAYSCGLCIVVATRIYHKTELLPVHPACDCSQEVLYADEPQTSAVSVQAVARAADGSLTPIGDLPELHQRIHDTFGTDNTAAAWLKGVTGESGKPIHYRDVVVEHEHGEIGPVIGVRGQHWTGPSDIAA
jgi:hypothetical protein